MPPAQRWKPRRWRSWQEFGGPSLRNEDHATRVYALLLKAAADPVGNYESLVRAAVEVATRGGEGAAPTTALAARGGDAESCDARDRAAQDQGTRALQGEISPVEAARRAARSKRASPQRREAQEYWQAVRSIAQAIPEMSRPGEAAMLGWPAYAVPWNHAAREREARQFLDRLHRMSEPAMAGLAAAAWMEHHVGAPSAWQQVTWGAARGLPQRFGPVAAAPVMVALRTPLPPATQMARALATYLDRRAVLHATRVSDFALDVWCALEQDYDRNAPWGGWEHLEKLTKIRSPKQLGQALEELEGHGILWVQRTQTGRRKRGGQWRLNYRPG